jgi:hypothetical protein
MLGERPKMFSILSTLDVDLIASANFDGKFYFAHLVIVV